MSSDTAAIKLWLSHRIWWSLQVGAVIPQFKLSYTAELMGIASGKLGRQQSFELISNQFLSRLEPSKREGPRRVRTSNEIGEYPQR